MKLTKAKQKWVLDKVAHYSSTLNINAPTVFMTMARYNGWKMANRERTGQRIGRANPYLLGVCHRDEGFIVVLVKKSPNLSRLDETIRHELIHYAKPSYNHCSQTFQDRMDQLKKGKVKNGRFYK